MQMKRNVRRRYSQTSLAVENVPLNIYLWTNFLQESIFTGTEFGKNLIKKTVPSNVL